MAGKAYSFLWKQPKIFKLQAWQPRKYLNVMAAALYSFVSKEKDETVLYLWKAEITLSCRISIIIVEY